VSATAKQAKSRADGGNQKTSNKQPKSKHKAKKMHNKQTIRINKRRTLRKQQTTSHNKPQVITNRQTIKHDTNNKQPHYEHTSHNTQTTHNKQQAQHRPRLHKANNNQPLTKTQTPKPN